MARLAEGLTRQNLSGDREAQTLDRRKQTGASARRLRRRYRRARMKAVSPKEVTGTMPRRR